MDSKNFIHEKFESICSKYITPMHEAVVLLGGEPCIWPIEDHCKFIKTNWDIKIKLFTNGMFPDRIKKLVDNKLIDAISVDVKTTKYDEVIGFPVKKYLKLLSETLDYLSTNPVIDVECRTTIPKDFNLDIEDIKQYMKQYKFKHILQEDIRWTKTYQMSQQVQSTK